VRVLTLAALAILVVGGASLASSWFSIHGEPSGASRAAATSVHPAVCPPHGCPDPNPTITVELTQGCYGTTECSVAAGVDAGGFEIVIAGDRSGFADDLGLSVAGVSSAVTPAGYCYAPEFGDDQLETNVWLVQFTSNGTATTTVEQGGSDTFFVAMGAIYISTSSGALSIYDSNSTTIPNGYPPDPPSWPWTEYGCVDTYYGVDQPFTGQANTPRTNWIEVTVDSQVAEGDGESPQVAISPANTVMDETSGSGLRQVTGAYTTGSGSGSPSITVDHPTEDDLIDQAVTFIPSPPVLQCTAEEYPEEPEVGLPGYTDVTTTGGSGNDTSWNFSSTGEPFNGYTGNLSLTPFYDTGGEIEVQTSAEAFPSASASVTINVTVWDSLGDEANCSAGFEVAPALHVSFSYAPSNPTANASVYFNTTTTGGVPFTSPSFGLPEYYFDWEWGFSNNHTVASSDTYYPNASSINAIYSASGNYTVWVNVTDSDGAYSNVSHTFEVGKQGSTGSGLPPCGNCLGNLGSGVEQFLEGNFGWLFLLAVVIAVVIAIARAGRSSARRN
jgi:hypothetical protein